ncbi:MAG: 3'-5' exonuclease [Chitinophagales bacterium]
MGFLDELNDVQRAAVEQIDGPVMIIAGPGSGKTRVLTYRIAHLIQQGIDPFRILALTFTNKASAEMRERITAIVGNEARNLYMGTFHSVFAKILRMEAQKLGFPNNFTIYDTTDSKSLIKSIIKEEGLNDKLYKPNIVYNRISDAKNNLITAKAYNKNIDRIAEDECSGRPKIKDLYAKYVRRCYLAGAMDFDDLILKMYELLARFPEVLYKYQHRFSHLMIDEFQDTNFAQYAIVKKFAAVHENICVVGDDAQSIYAFRGATIKNILDFETDYADLKVFKLEQNYRSVKYIVNAANNVISHNQDQFKKTIWTENIDGQKIKVVKAPSDRDEARLVANSIFEQKVREYKKNEDIAILYRTNAQSRALEESLRKLNIPYRIYGGLSFYQRKEIKDFIAYLRLTTNTNDEEALKRIINYPTRGIGNTTVEKLIVAANQNDCSIWQIMENIHLVKLASRTQNIIKNFVLMINSFKAQLADKSAYDLATFIGKHTGIVGELFKDKTIEGISRYENLQELLNGIKEFTEAPQPEYEEDELAPENNLSAYLQQISLLTDLDEKDDDPDKVKLMTIHAAKGLEFPSVFVVGLEENLFPSAMSMNTREDIEEERRLFYVAITRAKENLMITSANMRYKFGSLIYCQDSRFLDEIGDENIEYIGKKPSVNNTDSDFDFDTFDEPTVTYDVSSKNNYKKKSSPSIKPLSPPANLKRMKEVANNAGINKATNLNINIGATVEHQKFEKGKVLHLEGQGNNQIATIMFEKHGQKKIILKFAKLQVIS